MTMEWKTWNLTQYKRLFYLRFPFVKFNRSWTSCNWIFSPSSLISGGIPLANVSNTVRTFPRRSRIDAKADCNWSIVVGQNPEPIRWRARRQCLVNLTKRQMYVFCFVSLSKAVSVRFFGNCQLWQFDDVNEPKYRHGNVVEDILYVANTMHTTQYIEIYYQSNERKMVHENNLLKNKVYNNSTQSER